MPYNQRADLLLELSTIDVINKVIGQRCLRFPRFLVI